jgi:uncharacterized membrane-anchored protein YjiN (DUF445 family)
MQHVEEKSYRTFNSKETITKQLQTMRHRMQFLISNLNRMLSDLQKRCGDTTENQPLDQETISELLVKFHSEIGNMVQQHDKNNKELVEQIEEKVGSDLQYIRLNGAVVGGYCWYYNCST